VVDAGPRHVGAAGDGHPSGEAGRAQGAPQHLGRGVEAAGEGDGEAGGEQVDAGHQRERGEGVAEPVCEPAPRERGPRRGQLGSEATGERHGYLVLEVGHQSVVISSW
jgi:hypothetical protein